MQNGRTGTRRPRPVGSFAARSKGTNMSAVRPSSNGRAGPGNLDRTIGGVSA
jgi:hypothetical protein